MNQSFVPSLTADHVLSRLSSGTIPMRVALPVSAVSGLILVLSYPPFALWPLMFVSVACALWTLIGRTVLGALAVGLAFGGTFYAALLSWVSSFLGPMPWVALTSLEAGLFGLGAIPIALGFRWGSRRSQFDRLQLIGVPLVVAGLWVTREIVMGAWPYSGLPWARLGVALAPSRLADAASWVGTNGLSFLVVAALTGLIQWIRNSGPRSARGVAVTFITASVLVATPQFPTTDVGTLRIAWVQGNGPAGYFDDRSPGDVLRAQTAATTPLRSRKVDLVVWPEGGVDSDPLADRATALALDRIVDDAAAPVLINAAVTRNGRVFNTSLLWTSGPGTPDGYDKVNLVPFGEYIPNRSFFEWLAPDTVGLLKRDYTAGNRPPVVTLEGVPIGLAICFDAIYDAVIWDGVRSGAQVFVFQTNNADFRGTSENSQQLALARMRAIETGRSVVSVSTIGASQVVAPDGSIISTSAPNKAVAGVDTVPLRAGRTPASIVSPLLGIATPLLSATALLVLGLRWRRMTHHKAQRFEE
ncbi:MAG: apolipoprotein N-acyltransferase [Microbacterium sp.]|uniref:apolipoprotein N-acyltransferase n=1 Tax=Microbacterium sp. TaxID=51671 RepID=UPI001AD1AB3F|nr:apolipoprotein N-acyltransferase [Microbacterium sp.]MBN9154734.1 apolipoprotein N-acyltransferase [Microbacterium sp.]